MASSLLTNIVRHIQVDLLPGRVQTSKPPRAPAKTTLAALRRMTGKVHLWTMAKSRRLRRVSELYRPTGAGTWKRRASAAQGGGDVSSVSSPQPPKSVF
ncbi:MAG TPA: hypothetical protein VN829_05715 [Dongiaceae bacterium]|nr:hypothetical protein [Dongiaceae bacterium]